MPGKNKGWYQFVAKWIDKTKNWYQVAAKCICKNKDWYQVAANRIGKIIQRLIQEQTFMQISLNCHLAAFCMASWNSKKRPNDNLKRFACIFALVAVLVWSYQYYWPQLDISPYALGRNLISILGLTNPLGRKLISALVLTSHLKYHMIFLILLWWPRLFLTAPVFVYHITCFCNQSTTVEIFIT